MKINKPTDRQLQVLKLIHESNIKHGKGPSFRDVADHLSTCRSTAQQHIDALCTKGLIEKNPGVDRAIWLTKAGREYMEPLKDAPPNEVIAKLTAVCEKAQMSLARIKISENIPVPEKLMQELSEGVANGKSWILLNVKEEES